MSELSPRASDLVRAGRGALRPGAGDRERVSAALRARLGDAVLPLEVAVATSLTARVAWAKVTALAAAVGIAGAAVFVAVRGPSPAQVPSANVARDVAVAPVVEPAAAPLPPPPHVSVAARPMPPPEASASPARRRADRLAEEVAILSRATSELHAGRPASALKAIAEHQRKFPSGLLSEERRAARVQALCALGRRGEAMPELERLAPQSPNTLRAKQVCGANKRSL